MSRAVPFCNTVARPGRDGSWWFMNRKETGWSSYGFPYASPVDILHAFRVRLGEEGEDKASHYVELLVDEELRAPREEDLRRAVELQARFAPEVQA